MFSSPMDKNKHIYLVCTIIQAKKRNGWGLDGSLILKIIVNTKLNSGTLINSLALITFLAAFSYNCINHFTFLMSKNVF